MLTATETQTKAGAPKIRVEFGLESPDDSVGGRVDYYAPESYPPKVEQLLRVFAPALLESDEATELDPKALLYQRCALRLEIEASPSSRQVPSDVKGRTRATHRVNDQISLPRVPA